MIQRLPQRLHKLLCRVSNYFGSFELIICLGKHCIVCGRRKDMVVIYCTLIVKGIKTYAQVPAVIKSKVKDMLVCLDLGDLAVEESTTTTA